MKTEKLQLMASNQTLQEKIQELQKDSNNYNKVDPDAAGEMARKVQDVLKNMVKKQAELDAKSQETERF